MNALSAFNFNSFPIRVVTIEDQPWFLGSDACAVLGFRPDGSSYAHHLRYHLAAYKRRPYLRTALRLPAGRPVVLISESGLYKLTMRSDKALAREFQDWMTREVLPAIRNETGTGLRRYV